MTINKKLNKVFIIGDLHGCYKTLLALVKKLPHSATLVFVGDLIDRGDDSKKVIDYIKKNNHYCVIGNHELGMIDEGEKILNNPNLLNSNYWIKNYGGLTTYNSYKDNLDQFKKDIKWLESLPYYIAFPNLKDKNGRYLVVTHSHLSDTWKYRDYKEGTIEKEDFYTHILFSRLQNPKDNLEIFNVFGHTTVSMPIVTQSYANIDTGCVYNDQHLGVLTALEFPSKQIIQQVNIEQITED